MLNIMKDRSVIKPKLLALVPGFMMLLLFATQTIFASIGTTYLMLTFAFIALFLGVFQIKIKKSLYILIFKNLFSIIILLYYILMYIGLAVPNYEIATIVFQIFLVLSLVVVCVFSVIELTIRNKS